MEAAVFLIVHFSLPLLGFISGCSPKSSCSHRGGLLEFAHDFQSNLGFRGVTATFKLV